MTTECCDACGKSEHGAHGKGDSGLVYFVCFRCCKTTSVATQFLFDKDEDDQWWVKSEYPKSNTYIKANAEHIRILNAALESYLAKLIVT